MRLNIVFGGQAGQGANVLAEMLGETLTREGYYVFVSRDYQSLIRGGHNFDVLTVSDKPVYSNDIKIDVIIALDDNTLKVHEKELKKNAVILKGHKENMYYAGKLFKILGLDFKLLEKELKELEKRFEENLKNSRQGYEEAHAQIKLPEINKNKNYFMNGNQAIAQGAISSGLEIYYAYPMTPATPVLTELAQKQFKEKIRSLKVLELENEIAVINAGIGSAITGAKTMVGTSGGGFDLMTEGLSLCGIAGVPLVIYLAQRPGPATGVPTYTAQGDLNIARHAGHGEFPRLVVAPGDPIECQELLSQCFYFSQKFKIPCILIGDKHLADSYYTLSSKEKPKITASQKLTKFARYNGYEKDSKTGAATDEPDIIKKNVEARLKKAKQIEKEAQKFKQYKIYGKKNSKNIIISWGSTKGAILDVINDKNLDIKFIQILYIESFSNKIKSELKGAKKILVVENNSTAQLASLVAEKTGIFVDDKNKILRYDARPFLCDELRKEIEKRLK